MSMLRAIGANLILLAAAFGFGSLLKRLVPEKFGAVDRAALMLLGGLGLTGTVLFGVGQIWFTRIAIWVVLLSGCVACWRLAPQPFGGSGEKVKWLRPPVMAAAVVAAVVVTTAAGGLVKPTGDMEDDAIAYHFLGPKVWLRDGAIRPVTDQAYTAFPAIVETSYGALMAVGGERAPELFAVTGLGCALLISAALAMRLGAGAAGGWWCAALVAAMPAVYRGAYGGFIDAVYAGFVLAAARIAFDAESPGHYALLGIFCGFAAGTKYTGLIASALLLACCFVFSIAARNRGYAPSVKHIGIASGAAALVAIPVYARNWVLLGCPIYPPPPMLSRFFDVRYMSASAIERFHQYIFLRGKGMGRGVEALLMLPFNLTYHTSNFHGAGGIGLAPLALAPLGVVALWRDGFARALGVFAVLLTIAWFLTEQESRFLIAVYAAGAAFAVTGWNYARHAAPRLGPALSGLAVACSILYGLFMIGSARAQDIHAVVSRAYAEKRAKDEIPFRDSFGYVNHEPSVTKVLALEPFLPGFYFDKDYVKLEGDKGEETLGDAADVDAVLKQLPQLGVSHVLDVRWKGQTFRIADGAPGLTLVFERADQRVYQVDSIGR
jgi:hypothetical protein